MVHVGDVDSMKRLLNAEHDLVEGQQHIKLKQEQACLITRAQGLKCSPCSVCKYAVVECSGQSAQLAGLERRRYADCDANLQQSSASMPTQQS